VDDGSYDVAVWCAVPPSRDDVLRSVHPVFLAPGVRRQRWLAFSRLAARPVSALRAVRGGVPVRHLLRYLLLLDTARCLGTRSLRTIDGRPSPAQPLIRRLPRLGRRESDTRLTAAVIAQDEEELLPRMLESIGGVVTATVIVDGGSTDRTVDIARGSGAQVITNPWPDDFGVQRNVSMDAVATPWALIIDADEELEPALRELTPWVLSRLTTRIDAVFVTILTEVDGEVNLTAWPASQPRIHRRAVRYADALHPRVLGWHRAVHLPISGPYIAHRKSRVRQHRATLYYHSIDPSPYPPGYADRIAEQLSELERDEQHG